MGNPKNKKSIALTVTSSEFTEKSKLYVDDLSKLFSDLIQLLFENKTENLIVGYKKIKEKHTLGYKLLGEIS